MTLAGIVTFIPSLLAGTLVAHLLWHERSFSAMVFKSSVGAGLGLGINSILHFIALHAAPGRINALILPVVLLLILSTVFFYRFGMPKFHAIRVPTLTLLQWGLLAMFIGSAALSCLIFANYVISRPQGALDAWSIWNRAARFIHRDPENWIATLSPDLPLLRHADYPLLVPLNVAWGWDVLGNETLRIPMVQGGLFTFAAIFLMFGALALTKSVGQASLAAVTLMAASGIVPSGTSLVADVPLSYFILASAALMYLFTFRNDYPLLTLSGFMAGLAAWTKNEGLIFVVAGFIGLIIASPLNVRRGFAHYLAGLAIPLLIVVYFKSLAPPNDLAANSGADVFEKIADPARYEAILVSFVSGVFKREAVFLFIYMLIMADGSLRSRRKGISVLAALIVLQMLGYAAVYLVTPYDLSWHLFTSQQRLIFHVIPLAIFLCFSVSADPETALSARVSQGKPNGSAEGRS